MRYSKEQEEIIKEVKLYLKAVRGIKREKFELLDEYNEDPSPHSPSFQETKGQSLSQLSRMNDYTVKRDMILKKIELFNSVLDDFALRTFLLSTRQRQIIEVYMNAKSYIEMIDELNEHYYISASTYKRELPEICLLLAKYIDYKNIPSIDKLNQIFYEEIK